MSILVTGGAGYIGGHMVLGLLDAGESPVVVDNGMNGAFWAVRPGVPFIHGDVGDIDTVTEVIRRHGVDTVLHFAARLITPRFYGDPLEYYRANVEKSAALLEACERSGVRHFVFSSSAAVYGSPATSPVPETAPLAPITAYGWSKLMTEIMLGDLAAARGFTHVTLRYFNVAGADPGGRYGQISTQTTLLVQIAVQAALGIRPYIDIFGDDYPTADGTCVRDYIHVTDLVDAHLAALRHLRSGGPSLTLNCGYGHGYSVREVLDTAEAVSGRNFERRIAPRRRGDVAEIFADAGRLCHEFGWRPKYDSLTMIVEHALRWEKHLRGRQEQESGHD